MSENGLLAQRRHVELRTGVPYANLIAQQRIFSHAIGKYFDISPEHVISMPGTTGAIEAVRNHVLKINLRPGLKVLSVSPGYWRAKQSFQGLGFRISDVNTEPNGFDIDARELVRRIAEEKPELIYLSLPNNPTGAVFDPQDIVNGATLETTILFDLTLPSRDVDLKLLIKKLFNQFAGRKNLFIAGSTSKSHNTAEHRIGWLLPFAADDARELRLENKNVVATCAIELGIQQLGKISSAFELIGASFSLLAKGSQRGRFELVIPSRSVQSAYTLVRTNEDCREILADMQIEVMWGSEYGLSDHFIRLELLDPSAVGTFVSAVNL